LHSGNGTQSGHEKSPHQRIAESSFCEPGNPAIGPALAHTTEIERCLARLAAGDQAAREALITCAAERLRRLARKMLASDQRVKRWEETDDVFQNSVLRLHRALASVRPASAREFFGLAALEIRRELIDLARRYYGPQGAGLREAADVVPLDQAALDTTQDPQRLAEWTELHAAIARLPAEEREAFDLLWYNELPAAEAGALLGVSERTIRRRWQQARLSLHTLLSGDKHHGD
jgi:RNA polymerase sigma factor (sigma-70 family)